MEAYVDWNGWKVRPDNIPLNRPGAYRFRNLLKGDEFVGNYVGISGLKSGVAGRCAGHPSGARKFENAVRKYGKENFLLTPICYLLANEATKEDRFCLQLVEADHIASCDAIKNGYNIKASDGGVGPYGPEFSAIMRKVSDLLMQDPEVRRWFVEHGRKMASKLHVQKNSDGKSIVAVKAGTNAIAVLIAKEGIEGLISFSSRGGKAATSIKDEDGKSIHARKMRANADPYITRTPESKRAGARALHAQVDEQGRSLAGLRWAEYWHAEKDERGKSARAAAAGRNGMAAMQSVKDDDGVGSYSRLGGQTTMARHGDRLRAKARQNTHRQLDAFGRSMQTLKGVHGWKHTAAADLSCPFCNPEFYQDHVVLSPYMKRKARLVTGGPL